jgi:lysophospholipase L1-like esterase
MLRILVDGLGYNATFVGPYTGTHGTPGIEASEPTAPLLDGEEALNFVVDGGYADGVPDSFTSMGHAAFWGFQAAQDEPLVNGWVEEYQPDYMLVLLGFNDLGWFVSDPDGLIDQIGDIIQNARDAKPDVKLLVGNVVQRLFLEGRQDLVDNTNTYNELLAGMAPDWLSYESPLSIVDVAANYDCSPDSCPDGYDGLHPTVLGEHHIAQAFANVLGSDFGFAGNPYTVPESVEVRTVSVPTDVVAYSYPEGIFTTWNNMHNNRGYEIRSRVQGETDWWSSAPVSPNTWGSWLSWVVDGQTWETQVRTVGDGADRSDWSFLASAEAHPETAPGPSNITVAPLGDGVAVSWSAVDGYDVNRYGVLLWDRDTPGSYVGYYAATGPSLTVHGLTSGHRYDVWVATYINMAQGSVNNFHATPGGMPAAAHSVIIGGSIPGPPASLSVDVIDATSITLNWPAADNAAGYTIYQKSLTTDDAVFESVSQTTDLSVSLYYLFPGIWTYQFCIGSYNGDLQSGYGDACVTPPRCCGYKRDEQMLNASSAGSGNATGTGPVALPPVRVNSTAITTDPEVGQLYQLYTQAMAALQLNTTALTMAPPDTAVQLS